MSRRDDVGAGRMHLGVNDKGGPVDGSLSDHDASVVTDQLEVRDLDLREGDAEGVDPEVIGELRISGRDVPGDALFEAQLAEDPKGASQALLAVEAFLFGVFEARIRRQGHVADSKGLGCELRAHGCLLIIPGNGLSLLPDGQNSRTIRPRVPPASSRRWADTASAAGTTAATRKVTAPSSTCRRS